jgi:hypothetical protein
VKERVVKWKIRVNTDFTISEYANLVDQLLITIPPRYPSGAILGGPWVVAVNIDHR